MWRVDRLRPEHAGLYQCVVGNGADGPLREEAQAVAVIRVGSEQSADRSDTAAGSRGQGRRHRGRWLFVPTTFELLGDVPTRFENEVAQIRCLFLFLEYFCTGGHTADDSSPPPPTRKTVATPLAEGFSLQLVSS